MLIFTVDQLLMTDAWGYALPAFVAIWLSWSGKYVKKIIMNVAIYIQLRLDEPKKNHRPADEQPLLVTGINHAVQSSNPIILVLKDSGGGVRDLVSATWSATVSDKYKLSDVGSRAYLGIRLVILTTVVAILSVAMIVVGVYTARIKISVDSAARLESQHCGIWLFDSATAGREAATRAGIHELEKETRAGEYAQHCYGDPETFESPQCDFFYRQNLTFSRTSSDTSSPYKCPFESDTICILGQQSVTFETEVIDAGEIGVHMPSTWKFRRRMTCTPLSMEYPFVRNETRNGTTTYYYHYGQKKLKYGEPHRVDYTHITTGNPFDDGLAPVYEL